MEEIAAQLGVNRDTVYHWIEEKHMPGRFRRAKVDKWVETGKAVPKVE